MKKLIASLTLVAALALSTAAFGAKAPAVRFSTPVAGATTASTVTFCVALTNFSLDPADVGKRNKAAKGHLHFQMDGGRYDYEKYSGPNGALAKVLGIAGKYSPSTAPIIVYKHLPNGKHTLVVFLANNDHSAVGPKATIHFTVR